MIRTNIFTRPLCKIFLLLFALVMTSTKADAVIIYVKANASPPGNGQTWATAYTNLQSAIGAANSGDQIWVAAGTYNPGNGVFDWFSLKSGVAMYGGFPNTGNPTIYDRNWTTHVTILSGERGDPNSKADNNIRVVDCYNVTGVNPTLDGFTIRDGYGFDNGGGLVIRGSSPNIYNCTITENCTLKDGGGVFIEGGSPVFENCNFIGNAAVLDGGGMSFKNATGVINRCSFYANSGKWGGGIELNGTSILNASNCIFSGNSAVYIGGGIVVDINSTSTIDNCTFSGNTGFGAISILDYASATITNCIVWGNQYSDGIGVKPNGTANVSYSIVENGNPYPGTGNLNINPLFVSQPPVALGTSGDLHLQSCSPAIDAGTSLALTNDRDGAPRPINAAPNIPGNMDRGAYEFQGSTPAPTPVCAALTVQLGVNQTVTVAAAQVNGGSTGCGPLSFLINGQPSIDLNCTHLGQVNVSLSVKDYFQNTSTSNCSITVIENFAPTFTCPANQVIDTDPGTCEGTVPDLTSLVNDAADNCGSVTMSQNVAVGSKFGNAQGDQIGVTITADDGNGNQNTIPCIVTLTLNDNEKPTFTCPSSQLVPTDPGVCEGSIPDFVAMVSDAADNCGTATLSQEEAAGTKWGNMPFDQTTVYITADDGNGNQHTCFLHLTLMDYEAPTFTCPANQTVSMLTGVCEGTVPDLVAQVNDASDNCGTATLSQDMTANASFGNVHGDQITVTVTADDGKGNQNAVPCTVTLTLTDNEAPTFTCPTNQTIIANSGSCEGTVPDLVALVNDAADNCGTPDLSQDVAANSTFGNAQGAQTTVTITADDGNGNQNTTPCVVTLTLEDDEAPTFTCPPNQTINNNPNACEGTVPDLTAQVNDAADNCGTADLSQDVAANSTFGNADGDQIQVIVTADDGNGNQNTTPCVVTLTLNDNEAPTFTCPANQIINTNAGTCEGTVPDLVAQVNNAADNCGTATLSQDVAASSTFGNADGDQINVTISADDGNGNQNTTPCVVTLTLDDIETPTFTCPPYQFVITNPGVCEGSVPDLTSLVTDEADNCGTANLTQDIAANTVFGNADGDQLNVTITADDGNGNQNTTPCVVTLYLNDLEPPSFTCPGGQVIPMDAGICEGSVPDITALINDVSDNCGTPTLSQDIAIGTNFGTAPGDQITVNVVANDGNGNQSYPYCAITLTLADNEAPVPTCLHPTVQLDTNGNYTLSESDVYNGGTDNCGTINFVSMNPSVVNCSATGGSVNVTITVNDGHGNEGTCIATVDVGDNIPPNPTCKTTTVQLDANGSYSLLENDVFAGGTDNCGTVNYAGMSQASVGCSDVGAPISVTVTANDGNGNEATCNATINVEDNVDPIAQCTTQVINAFLDANAQYAIDPNIIDDGSTDACGIQTLAATPSLLDCQHIGTNTATLTVTDENGNSATCTATIEIAEFLTIDEIESTPESCEGMNDGSLVITATAGGGQLSYSIDGGANFQTNNTFNNLSPNTYNIVVKVTGVPAVCEKTDMATVAAGNPTTTWYKDMDGDGYTDGITLISCSQPSGFIASPAAGTDCNDNDPDQYPGQTWYEDLDGDDYGSGTWVTACSRPPGCYTSGELAETDTDCEDTDPDMHPYANEICDGLDNDCNGLVDDGISNETYTGNLMFSNQSQLDDWPSCYSIINGSLTVTGGNVTDLSPLANITDITGNLMIIMNGSLTTLNGLDNLVEVGGNLLMYYNFQLGDCCAISDLLDNGGVAGITTIFLNATGSPCNSTAAIIAACNSNNLVIPNHPGPTVSATSDYLDCGKTTVEPLQVFPSPASTTIQVKWTGGDNNPSGTVRLVDLYGRVWEQQQLTGSNQFNVFNLKPGVYSIWVLADGYKQQRKRVMVQR